MEIKLGTIQQAIFSQLVWDIQNESGKTSPSTLKDVMGLVAHGGWGLSGWPTQHRETIRSLKEMGVLVEEDDVLCDPGKTLWAISTIGDSHGYGGGTAANSILYVVRDTGSRTPDLPGGRPFGSGQYYWTCYMGLPIGRDGVFSGSADSIAEAIKLAEEWWDPR